MNYLNPIRNLKLESHNGTSPRKRKTDHPGHSICGPFQETTHPGTDLRNHGEDPEIGNPQAIVGDSIVKPKSAGESNKEAQERVLEAARKVFAPEFLNRLDALFVFPALTEQDIVGITKQQVEPLIQQLAETKEIELDIDPKVVDFLAQTGFSTEFGARQLARAIKQHVKVPLAELVLNKEFRSGDNVQAYLDGSSVKFRKIG